MQRFASGPADDGENDEAYAGGDTRKLFSIAKKLKLGVVQSEHEREAPEVCR